MLLNEAKELASKYLMETYSPYPVLFKKGQGAYLYDEKGTEYLDFFSGIAVNNLGNCHEEVVKAVKKQAEEMMHISNLYYSEPMLKLAKSLVEISGLKDGKVFFCNSGTEANEGALKLARLYGSKKNKTKVVSALNSFHGRTLGGMTLTGQEKFHKGFSPLVPEITYTAFNDKKMLKEDLTADTAAFFLECIQGEGGVNVADEGYLHMARELCDKHDILLVFDEVQTGIGRTGKFFAYEHFGIKPDVVTLAKALGGGLPIGAIVASGEKAIFKPGQHAATFGGNPVAAKAGTVVLKELAKPGFLEDVIKKGELLSGLLAAKHPRVKSVRGLGLMLGLEVEAKAQEVAYKAFEKGLIIGTAGLDIVRLLPPLSITEKQIIKAVDLLFSALTAS